MQEREALSENAKNRLLNGGKQVYQVDSHFFHYCKGRRLTIKERVLLEANPTLYIPIDYMYDCGTIRLRDGFEPGPDDHICAREWLIENKKKLDHGFLQQVLQPKKKKIVLSQTVSGPVNGFGGDGWSSQPTPTKESANFKSGKICFNLSKLGRVEFGRRLRPPSPEPAVTYYSSEETEDEFVRPYQEQQQESDAEKEKLYPFSWLNLVHPCV